MSRLAVAVIEGEELRIRETFGEKEGDKRTEAAVRGVEDSWTVCHRDVWTSRQRNTRIVRQ